ncbi:MAG: FeoB-associated Cys-rich membrane protein [Oscillospiraceae bacterium]|nr:FeoB-associated Cys-rich membrane protein [Oscillospiraceae bacterium]
MNGADILVLLFIAALVAAAFFIMCINRKRGRRGCGCDCSHCGGCGKSRVNK